MNLRAVVEVVTIGSVESGFAVGFAVSSHRYEYKGKQEVTTKPEYS